MHDDDDDTNTQKLSYSILIHRVVGVSHIIIIIIIIIDINHPGSPSPGSKCPVQLSIYLSLFSISLPLSSSHYFKLCLVIKFDPYNLNLLSLSLEGHYYYYN